MNSSESHHTPSLQKPHAHLADEAIQAAPSASSWGPPSATCNHQVQHEAVGFAEFCKSLFSLFLTYSKSQETFSCCFKAQGWYRGPMQKKHSRMVLNFTTAPALSPTDDPYGFKAPSTAAPHQLVPTGQMDISRRASSHQESLLLVKLN